MKRLLMAAVAAASLFFVVSAAKADTLEATSISPGQWSSFTITYTDNGDGLFALSEMTNFSGMTFSGVTFTTILAVPNIPGFALCPSPPNCSLWEFHRPIIGASVFRSPQDWTYAETTASVPGPIAGAGFPGILLAGGGLLALWRRKRRAALAV